MKKIYIVLTHTGTILSRIIKSYTKDEFSHVSISLDETLENMYSFGRINPYNPFIGGFVHEYINKGTFKRFYNTKAKIYSLEVSDKQYEIIKNEIKFIELEKNKYKFNIAGLFAVGFSKKIGGENSFYCAEFVKYLFEKAKIGMILPEIVRPENFNNRDELIEVYHGFLRKYNAEKVKFSDILKESILLYNKKESIV